MIQITATITVERDKDFEHRRVRRLSDEEWETEVLSKLNEYCSDLQYWGYLTLKTERSD